MDFDVDEMMERAADLAKVSQAVESALEGLQHDEKMSILHNCITRAIVNNNNEYESDVIADMTTSFMSMVMTYKVINSTISDDDDDGAEEAEGQTRQ
jgi:ATP-dependent helicase YprA (DUF1998 family)